MPSSWSCSSIILPNPTVPHSTDWAGQDICCVPLLICDSHPSLYLKRVLKIQVLGSPVVPVVVVTEILSQQKEGCVHVVLTHPVRSLCSNAD